MGQPSYTLEQNYKQRPCGYANMPAAEPFSDKAGGQSSFSTCMSSGQPPCPSLGKQASGNLCPFQQNGKQSDPEEDQRQWGADKNGGHWGTLVKPDDPSYTGLQERTFKQKTGRNSHTWLWVSCSFGFLVSWALASGRTCGTGKCGPRTAGSQLPGGRVPPWDVCLSRLQPLGLCDPVQHGR